MFLVYFETGETSGGVRFTQLHILLFTLTGADEPAAISNRLKGGVRETRVSPVEEETVHVVIFGDCF